MDQEALKKLYNRTVIQESKAPYHFDPAVKHEEEVLAYNPMCGDKYKLQLKMEEDVLKETHFHGFGCALSKASTSAMLRAIEGMSQTEIIEYCKSFIAAVEGNQSLNLDEEVLNVLVELNGMDSRSDCIKLSLKSLLEYLEEKS